MQYPVKLTDNFTWKEVERSDTATKYKIDNSVPEHLRANVLRTACFLECLRARIRATHTGKEVIATSSWFRGDKLNAAIPGSSKTSAHRFGLAADIRVPGWTAEKLYQFIRTEGFEFDQVIQEFDSWVHIGFTEGKPRNQSLRAVKKAGKTVYIPE